MSNKNRISGYVRWYDRHGDDGVLVDFDGHEYYFNSFSFEGTKFISTGICKKTGIKKTIKSKYWGGLFLQNGTVPDKRCATLQSDTPVIFEQAKGIEQRWAVKIELDLSKKAARNLWEHKLFYVLETLYYFQYDPSYSWTDYSLKRLHSILEKLELL